MTIYELAQNNGMKLEKVNEGGCKYALYVKASIFGLKKILCANAKEVRKAVEIEK